MTAFSNYSWAQLVLQDLNVPQTPNNINNVARWMTWENPPTDWFNRNNPLNASLNTGTVDGTGSYPDLTTGAANTASMISFGARGGAIGPTIYNALAMDASSSDFSTAVCSSAWASSRYGVASCGAPPQYVVVDRLSTFMAQGPNPPVVNDSGNVTGSAPPNVGGSGTANAVTNAATAQDAFTAAYPPAGQPPVGFQSDLAEGLLVINGTSADALLGNALVAAQLDLNISQASTLTLTIHDPHRQIVNLPEFSQASLLEFFPLVYQLSSVEKQDSVLTCTFQSWAIAALRAATGAFTVAPGQVSRTDFARIIATQSVNGIGFLSAPVDYLASLGVGYDASSLEQLSRGTVDSPLEDSWTCLQRLASEIQWVCFESFGNIYFGPYSYLASLPPVLAPAEFSGGIGTINGTYDVGQPLGTITVNAVAGSWSPTIGQCVNITQLGPFNGTWIVSELSRQDLLEPDIEITLMQPLPSLPEPSTGGAAASVGAGYTGAVQTKGGALQAQGALKFALSKVGLPYSEALGARLGPNAYDCSGLVYEAYLSVGVQLAGTTTYGMWPTGGGSPVPAGIQNLEPGDLLFFGNSVKGPAEHVAMVDTVNTGAGTVTVVEAANPSQGIITDTLTPTVGAAYGPQVYQGALRPAP